MWLVTTFIAAVAVSAAHLGARQLKKFRLDFFALMLWGTFIMVLVDRAIGFVQDGGALIEFTTGGLVESGLLLGIMMLIPLALIWSLFAFTPLRAKLAS